LNFATSVHQQHINEGQLSTVKWLQANGTELLRHPGK